AKAIPVSMTWRSTPSRPQRKSRCHQERRNSPAVTACSPTSSCFLIARSISRSSTALRSAPPRSPFARFSRASFTAAGRSRLPTRSARNACFDRFRIGPSFSFVVVSLLAPFLLRNLHDPSQLCPLLVLGQDIAFLAGGEAALRREAQVIEVDEFRCLLDAALENVFRFQRSAFRGD